MDQALLDQLHTARFPLATTPLVDTAAGGFYRVASGSEAFFSTGVLVDSDPAQSRWLDRSIGRERWGVSLVALGVLLLYCWLLYRYRKAISSSLKAVFSLEEAFLVFDYIPQEFVRFLSLSRLLFCLSGALFLFLLPSFSFDGYQTLLWWSGGVLYLYGSLGVQRLLLVVVSRFDAVPDRLLVLGNVNRLDWAVLGAIFPLVVILVLGFQELWSVGAGLLVLSLVVHWVRLFLYFKWAGFSIVQWFLYLCTLEVLPFTLLWGLVVRVELFH